MLAGFISSSLTEGPLDPFNNGSYSFGDPENREKQMGRFERIALMMVLSFAQKTNHRLSK